MTLRCLTVAFFMCAAVAFAQQKAQPKKAAAPKAVPAPVVATQFPLETLRVEGNKRVPTAKIIAASGLKIGRTVVKQDFEAARTRLLESGAFINVGYEFKPSAAGTGYDAMLEVTELAEYYPYRFEDLPAKDDAIRAGLNQQNFIFTDQIPVTETIVKKYTQAIEQVLGGNVRVVGKLGHPDGLTDLEVIFTAVGARPSVAQVAFLGNVVVPEDLLITTFSQAAVGVPYSDAEMRRQLDYSVRPLYDARGRIRVSFPKITTAKAERVDGVVVTVTVDEGVPYNLGQVRFQGVAASETSQLARVADLKKGDIANFDDVKAAVDRVHKRYRNNGYIHVSEKVDREVQDSDHTVNVVITVDLGSQYRFGKLKIEGLDIFSEPEIRKMWGDREGKPFQPDYPESFLKKVREENMFDNLGKTRAETDIDEASRIVDVTLHFTGGKPENEKERRRGQGPPL
jgi:outer membrane protein insertion porin family